MGDSVSLRRRRRLLGVIGATVLLGTFSYHWHIERQARRGLQEALQRQQQDEVAVALSLLQAGDSLRALPPLWRAYQRDPRDLTVGHHLAEALAEAEEQPVPLLLHNALSGAFCGDGSRVVIGHADGRATLWEAASGRLVASMDSALGEVEGVACSPDGHSVMTQRKQLSDTSSGSSWLLWDVASAKQRSQSLGSFAEGDAHFTPDSRSLFGFEVSWEEGAAKSSSVVLYSVDSGRPMHKFDARQASDLGRLSHDGSRILTAQTESHEGEEEAEFGVIIWDARSGKQLHSFALDETCSDVQWMPDDRHVLTLCAGDPALRDPQTGKLVESLKMNKVTIRKVSPLPSGQAIVALDDEGLVRIISVGTGKPQITIGHRDERILTMRVDRAGRRLLTSTMENEPTSFAGDANTNNRRELFHIWDIAAGKQLNMIQYRPAGIRSAALSPSGEQILFIDSAGRAVLQPALSRHPRRVFVAPDQKERGRMESAAWSLDGRLLLGVRGDGGRIIDAATGAELAPLPTEAGESCCSSAAFFANGRTIVATGYRWVEDKDAQTWSVLIWDGRTGKRLRELEVGNQRLYSVAASPAGRQIAAGAEDGAVLLWEPSAQKPGSLLKGHTAPVLALAFSPDGNTLASGSVDGTVRLWRVDGQILLRSLAIAAARVTQVGFGEAGRWLFAVSADNTLRIFEVNSGALLRTFGGFTSSIMSAALSSDNRLLAIVEGSQRICLFDPERGLLLRTLRLTAETLSVRFSADGAQLFTVEASGAIAAWDLLPERRAPLEVQRAASSLPGGTTLLLPGRLP